MPQINLTHLLEYSGDAVAISSALLLGYRNIFQKIMLIWFPKQDSQVSHTFWSIADKAESTLEVIAMNSHSRSAKDAEDFRLMAKMALPDTTIDKINERVKQERLTKGGVDVTSVPKG